MSVSALLPDARIYSSAVLLDPRTVSLARTQLMLSLSNPRPHTLIVEQLEVLFETGGQWVRVFELKDSLPIGPTSGDFSQHPLALPPQSQVNRAAVCIATRARHVPGRLVRSALLRPQQNRTMLSFRASGQPGPTTFSPPRDACAGSLDVLLPRVEPAELGDLEGRAVELPHAPVGVRFVRAHHSALPGPVTFSIVLTQSPSPRDAPARRSRYGAYGRGCG